MSNLNQEFFWTPTELANWIRRVSLKFELWLVVWRVGKSADLVDPDSIHPSMFEGTSEDSIQLFLGLPALSSSPQWRIAGDRRELDFANSYAVQLAPSILTSDGTILLQGRLAILRPTDYVDSVRALKLAELFRRMQDDMRDNSDDSHIVVQPLTTGEVKRWKNMLLGKALSESGLRLKQFAKGEVEFRIEQVKQKKVVIRSKREAKKRSNGSE